MTRPARAAREDPRRVGDAGNQIRRQRHEPGKQVFGVEHDDDVASNKDRRASSTRQASSGRLLPLYLAASCKRDSRWHFPGLVRRILAVGTEETESFQA
jgi:hypothetical protein